jgi:FkbM family methyltransferase
MILSFLKPVVERVPFVANLFRHLRDSRALNDDFRTNPHGVRMIGNRSMQDGTFEPGETRLVKSLLGATDVVINVGANIGYYAALARRAGKYVVAVEPLPMNLRYLLRNLAENGGDRDTEVFPVAVTGAPGVVSLFGANTGASLVRGWAGAPTHTATLVPGIPIDTLVGARFAGRKTLVIMDVEGAEFTALQGATRLIESEPAPVWMIEIVKEGNTSDRRVNPHLLETFDLFWSRGYSAVSVADLHRIVSREEIAAIAAGGPDTIPTYNFVFSRDPATFSALANPSPRQ